jgi:hypothetical protein
MASKKRTVSDVTCSACHSKCELKLSKTEKNPGRCYNACPQKCKVFNGWFDGPITVSATEPQARKTKKATNDTCAMCFAPFKPYLCQRTGLVELVCAKCRAQSQLPSTDSMPPLEDFFQEVKVKAEEPPMHALMNPTTNDVYKNVDHRCSTCNQPMLTGISNSVRFGDEFYFCLQHKQQFGGWKIETCL